MQHLREVSAFTVAEQRTERAAQPRPLRLKPCLKHVAVLRRGSFLLVNDFKYII